MIEDVDIPDADPAAVVRQYEPVIQKIANRYASILYRSSTVDMDDLIQVGRIKVLQAQKCYDPSLGASFLTFIFKPVKWAIRRALGINNAGEAPEILLSLDEPITDDDSLTLADTIADPAAVPIDEPMIEEETRRETSEQVRAALDRMKSDKQRTAVSLVWLEGKTREQAAAEMKMKTRSFCSLEKYGRSTLRRDRRLRQYAQGVPFIHVSVAQFNTTWTSATEYIALRRLELDPDYISRKEAVAEEIETGRHWTPAQELAYINRLRRKRAEEKETAEGTT